MSGEKNDIMWRLYLSFCLILVFGIVIVVQIGKIQFVQGESYRAKGDSLQLKYRVIPAKRGNVYAESGNLLAASFPYYKIIMDPVAPSKELFNKKVDSLALCLSQTFGDKSKNEYKRILVESRNKEKRYVVLYKKATVPQMKLARNFPIFRQGQYSGGLLIEPVEYRINPYGLMANRTIGYVRNETKVGIEGAYNDALSGVTGKQLMRKAPGGVWVPLNAKNEVEPVDGDDVFTTIDINIQDISETALRSALIKHNAAWGTAIVMEVATGKIKAITNLTRLESGGYEERYNYAIAELVEPGSTFKLFSLLALFEDGYVGLNDSVDLNNGSIQYYNRTMNDSEGRHHYRNVTVETAFEKSSNVGISRLVNEYYKNNKEKYLNRIHDVGLDQITGVDIAGEPNPKIKTDPTAKNFSGVTLPWMSVGYELQITPLQLLNFYNAIANDGKLMKPMLVSQITSYGQVVHTNKPEVLNNSICSDNTLKKLQACLLAVVDSGTAKNIHNPYYQIAGKTGTAQLIENGRYVNRYLASFAGYFPADNPKYSCIVMVNSPANGVFYGGYVAGPVFREIADKVHSHHISMATALNDIDSSYQGVTAYSKGYRYDFEEILDWFNLDNQLHEDEDWIIVHPEKDTLKASQLKIADNVMPSVKGMGLRDAMYLLENKGLKVEASGRGKVINQSIDPGQTINKGMYVVLKLG